MSRYTFQESIRDNATLPLHFEPRLPDYHIDKEGLDVAFNELANDLSEDDRNKLSQKAAKMSVFLKAPERVKTIVADIVEHFKTHVEPQRPSDIPYSTTYRNAGRSNGQDCCTQYLRNN